MAPEIKKMLFLLLKDIPDDIRIIRYVSKDVSCKELKEDLEKEGEMSNEYFNELFRISRDLLIRKTNKQINGKNKNSTIS